MTSPGPRWLEGGAGNFWQHWGYDLDGVWDVIVPGNSASLFLGRLRGSAEPETPAREAARIVGCNLRSNLDQGLVITDVEQIRAGAIEVDGRSAVNLRVQVAVEDLGPGSQGLLYDVIVVPGPGDDTFFLGELQYPDGPRIAIMDTAVAGLTVS